MSFKDTWARWEKEEKERKPETEYYQWVDKNGYVHDKEREIWHLSVYDFVVMLKSAFKISIILYLAYMLSFFLNIWLLIRNSIIVKNEENAIINWLIKIAVSQMYDYSKKGVCAQITPEEDLSIIENAGDYANVIHAYEFDSERKMELVMAFNTPVRDKNSS